MKGLFKQVRFICAIPRRTCDNTVYQIVHEKCEFKIGMGPCGKHVVRLEVETTEQLMVITQTTIFNAMHETKHFTYKLSDVLGRIEATAK